MNAERLREGAEVFGVELDEAQLRAFQNYLDELLAWNEKFNLTSITDVDEVVSKHFLDSLSLFVLAPRFPLLERDSPALAVIDVGTGAGFPAIPLKIVRPAWRVTLLEATRKKCDFLEHIVKTLNLKDVKTVWGRAETAGHQAGEREAYDLVVARAVAELNTLVEYLLPFARVGGLCVAWKGDTIQGEVNVAKGVIEKLGGKLSAVKQVHVPGIDAQARKRHLVVVEKTARTPDAYPRREGVPAKKPLK